MLELARCLCAEDLHRVEICPRGRECREVADGEDFDTGKVRCQSLELAISIIVEHRGRLRREYGSGHTQVGQERVLAHLRIKGNIWRFEGMHAVRCERRLYESV